MLKSFLFSSVSPPPELVHIIPNLVPMSWLFLTCTHPVISHYQDWETLREQLKKFIIFLKGICKKVIYNVRLKYNDFTSSMSTARPSIIIKRLPTTRGLGRFSWTLSVIGRRLFHSLLLKARRQIILELTRERLSNFSFQPNITVSISLFVLATFILHLKSKTITIKNLIMKVFC